jgi:hypothetical protein
MSQVDDFEDLFDKNINCTSYREYIIVSSIVIFSYVILHHPKGPFIIYTLGGGGDGGGHGGGHVKFILSYGWVLAFWSPEGGCRKNLKIL